MSPRTARRPVPPVEVPEDEGDGLATAALAQALGDTEHHYHGLARVMALAFDDAKNGKGGDRHAELRGLLSPFEAQASGLIARMAGPGYPVGQAMKKAHEAMELEDAEAALSELAGAVVYLCLAYLTIEAGVRR